MVQGLHHIVKGVVSDDADLALNIGLRCSSWGVEATDTSLAENACCRICITDRINKSFVDAGFVGSNDLILTFRVVNKVGVNMVGIVEEKSSRYLYTEFGLTIMTMRSQDN